MNASHSNIGDRNKFYEPLTSENAAVILVDHQIGLFTGVVDTDVLTLKHNVVALAKAAHVLGVPTIITATAPDSMWGPTIPALIAVKPRQTSVETPAMISFLRPKASTAASSSSPI